MKTVKSILAIVCFLLFALSLTSAPADTSSANPAPFTTDDAVVDDLNAGMSTTQVEGLSGKPNEIKYSDVTPGDKAREVWGYDGMNLTFENDRLVKAEVFGKGHTGPRGVKVGDPVTSAIRKFYISPKAYGDVFYWNEGAGDFNPNLPVADCGYMKVNADGTYELFYLAYSNPTSEEILTETSEHTAQGHSASFNVKASPTGVISFEWSAD